MMIDRFERFYLLEKTDVQMLHFDPTHHKNAMFVYKKTKQSIYQQKINFHTDQPILLIMY